MIGEIRLVPPLSWRRDLRGTSLAALLHGGLIGLVLAGLSAEPQKIPPPSSPSMVVELVPQPQPQPAPLPVATPQPSLTPPQPAATPVARKAPATPKPTVPTREATPAATDMPSSSLASPASPAQNSPPSASPQVQATEQAEAFVPPRSDVAGLDNPRPPYPTLARRRGWEGLVVVLVMVNELGLAQSVELHQSSGHDILDQSALTTVRSWRFSPARRGGHTVPASVQVPIRFSLDGKA